MSRIRSIHPGLWTDERFVAPSPLARLLFIGIWNECDDQGVFEWSPLKLKMRLLPADNADPAALLDEIEAAGCVMRFVDMGKQYGVVRNFTRYQRPKKPNALYPLPEVAASFASGSEPVPNQFPTDPEIDAQREEGGGNRSSEPNGSGAEAPKSPSAIDLKAAIFASGVPLLTSTGSTDRNARSMIGRWRKDHIDGAVLDVLAAATAQTISDPIPWINRALETRNGQSRSLLAGSTGTGSLSEWADDWAADEGSGPH